MNEKRIDVGICQWSLPVQGPCALDVAAELGFSGVELEFRNPERGFPLSKQCVQELYLSKIREHRLSIPSLAINELDFYCLTGSMKNKETQTALDAIYKGLQTAAALNIPKIQIPCFNKSELNSKNQGRAAEIFRDVCEAAKEYDITVATENVLSPTEMIKLIKRVDKANFKLYFDTQNYYLKKGFNTAEVLEQLFPYVCEIHVKDGRNGYLSGDLLGEGDSGFFNAIQVIKKNHYSGWLLLENYYDQEPLSLQDENPLTLIKKDFEILKKAIA